MNTRNVIKILLLVSLVANIFSEGKLKYLSSKIQITNNVNVNENRVQVNINNNIEEHSERDEESESSSSSSADHSSTSSSADHSSTSSSADHSSTSSSADHSSTSSSADHSSTASSADNSSTSSSADHSSTSSSADHSSTASSADHSSTASSADHSSTASSAETSQTSTSESSSSQTKISSRAREMMNNLKYGSLIKLEESSDLENLFEATDEIVRNGGVIDKLTISFQFVLKEADKTSLYKAFTNIKELNNLEIVSLKIENETAYDYLENVLAHIKIKQISLQFSKLFRDEKEGDHDFRLVKALLKDSAGVLEKIFLRETTIQVGFFETIARNIDSLTKLTDISCFSCGLGLTHAAQIEKIIVLSNSLKSVTLNGNNITKESITKLLNAAVDSDSLVSLDLTNNDPKVNVSEVADLVSRFTEKGGKFKPSE